MKEPLSYGPGYDLGRFIDIYFEHARMWQNAYVSDLKRYWFPFLQPPKEMEPPAETRNR